MNQFCEMKGILRQFSVARTPQQNRVAKRRNRTLIEAARTMLADSKLPTTFGQKQLILLAITPTLSFIRPFGCHVTILNTIDHLGKFDGKADEGSGPDWLYDIDALTRTMKTKDQAANSSGTVSGILFLNGRVVFVLFDTGATHSVSDHEYQNCPLHFDDKIRFANLLPLEMSDFDISLGMNWLTIVEPVGGPGLVMVIFKKTTESVIKKEDMAERKLSKNVNVVTVPFTRVDTYLGSKVLFAFEFQRNLQAGGAHEDKDEDIRRSPCKDKDVEDTEDILKAMDAILERGVTDIEPIAPMITVNRLVLEWEEKIKLHQEKEMKFDKWRSKIFNNKHLASVKEECEVEDEGGVTNYGVIGEVSKRRAFCSLNEDILKITILKTNTPYPSRKMRRDLDNSTSNVLIPLDSWTSGLLVYKLPLSGPHYTKDYPLKEGKTLEEAYYTQFGGPFQGGGYRATASGYYQRNNTNPSFQEQRQSMEDTLSKFISESAKIYEENSNLIKEIQASIDAAIRNQEASIKTLEIQIGQMSKEIHVTWAHLEKKQTRLRLYTKSFEETVHTERGDGIAITKRRRQDFHSGDGVTDLATASERSRLKEDLESSTW
ncbi:pyruvate dehydrogenase (acetyl-transferring) kinase, mitochondrial [Tanacetum coccineum]